MPEIFSWKVNFSSKRNCWDGSIFSVVSFLFILFIDLETPLAQSSVSCNDPPYPFHSIALFGFTTPFPTHGHYNRKAYSSSISACPNHSRFKCSHAALVSWIRPYVPTSVLIFSRTLMIRGFLPVSIFLFLFQQLTIPIAAHHQ